MKYPAEKKINFAFDLHENSHLQSRACDSSLN